MYLLARGQARVEVAASPVPTLPRQLAELSGCLTRRRYMTYIADSEIVNSDYICHILRMAPDPTFSVKKLIALTPEMAEAIASYRFEQRIGAESEAIRRLIEIGLQSAKQSGVRQ
jgi:hypothetical protein